MEQLIITVARETGSAGPPTTITTPARSGGISRAMTSPWIPRSWERTAAWSLSGRSCPPF